MKKMNNKGFSLVELIVVVLIMAIIAVALAPQVMKWVENSRKSTDIENYNALVEACNVASTNEDFLKNVTATAVVVSMKEATGNANGTSINSAAGSSQLTTILNDTLPDWQKTKITGAWGGETLSDGNAYAAATGFTISITKSTNGIKVEKTKAPVKNFS